MAILKLRKKNLPSKDYYFLEDVDIEKLLVSNKISLGEKNYKYFIGYFIMVIKLNHWYIASWNKCICKKVWWTNLIDVFFDSIDVMIC